MSQTEKGVSTELSQVEKQLVYQSGFGNHFATEAIQGALPHGQNNPQRANFGLYAEQLSGSSFSAPRHENLRTWFYRIRPSVLHGDFKEIDRRLIRSRPFDEFMAPPNQIRWSPPKVKAFEAGHGVDFIDGLITLAGNGDRGSLRGSAVHIYSINKSMTNRFFYNSDGEFLIVPEKGTLLLRTECGDLTVKPGEIAVIPRGIKFQVHVDSVGARGYVSENYGPPFRLPYLSVIGSNGLANPRDFLAPTAKYEERSGSFELVNKFLGRLYKADLDHSPIDCVAWHGNYYPYKYDLANFQVVASVSFDHSDPSIFTVLSSPSEHEGTANVDFVIFAPRWMVAEHTFRPPYFHRNCMSEFMGLIFGSYDAKEEGFVPGGGSLHNCMSAHGPDAATYEKASNAELKPTHLDNTLAIMFESSLPFQTTKFGWETELRQRDYLNCWKGLKANFKI